MANTKWTMNEKQKQFVEVLKKHADGVTMFELKLKGIEFATGSINTLITKGIVATDEAERVFACDVVYNGVVVGHVSKKGKVYRLAEAMQTEAAEAE